ncbi:hypothetical protein FD755_014978 [Muntiacus reevesi]|uniref:Uncharacterized protein n=2 Tax=Muntiacus TaxID=9885 RepID=A0A5N3XGV3_MUNRE|nr:hypothetical protein FD754_014947 [Muntiacus muntjak]KAB0373319.1 hypothetical protein FD755_014978 [Muntiacus reevesi]
MDPSLLRERELFKKRALSTPVVEKRSVSSEASSSKKKKAKLEHGGSSGSKQNSVWSSNHWTILWNSLTCVSERQCQRMLNLLHHCTRLSC